MTFSAPIMSPMFAEPDGVGDRAGGDDRALAGHEPRHRGDRADPARVRERDVGAREVVGGELVRRAPWRSARRTRPGSRVNGRRPASRMTGTISVRVPSFFSTSTAMPRLTRAVVDAVRLAVALVEVVGHHRHVLLDGQRDRVGDQVGERDLLAAVLELLAPAVHRRDGHRAERGRRRDRAALVHVAGEHRRAALDDACGVACRRAAAAPLPPRRRARRPW